MGGASGEREVSLASGRMIAAHLPPDRYEVILFDTLALMAANPELTPDLAAKARRLLTGRLLEETFENEQRCLPAEMQEDVKQAAASAAPATEAIQVGEGERRIDVAFLALHGRYGEDGTLQGMLDLLGIPYVGSGVLASALAMDKTVARKVLAAEGVPVPRAVVVEREDAAPAALLCADAPMPAFVKPSRQGSSLGMSRVERVQDLQAALDKAFEHDTRVLVEEEIVGRELTVGIIGNRRLTPLPVVEIVSKREFFDYQAKYDPAFSDEICPADLPEDQARRVQDLAVKAHRALDCRGLSRVDMILQADGRAIVLEVNTLPGMTVNSLLPKAAHAAGIPFGDLLDRLVRLALGEE
jgi:D-alanine-D-alanine ligase